MLIDRCRATLVSRKWAVGPNGSREMVIVAADRAVERDDGESRADQKRAEWNLGKNGQKRVPTRQRTGDQVKYRIVPYRTVPYRNGRTEG